MDEIGNQPKRGRRGLGQKLLVGLAAAGLVLGWVCWRRARFPTGTETASPRAGPGRPAAHDGPDPRHAAPPARGSPAAAPDAEERLAAASPGRGTPAADAQDQAAATAGPAVRMGRPTPGVVEVTVTGLAPALSSLGDGAWRVTVEGALALAVRGEPALPFLRRDVLLADDSETSLEVAACEWEVMRCPALGRSPGFVSRSDGGPGASHAGDGVSQGRPFPQSPAWLTPVYRLHGLRGVGVILCPFRYDAVAGTLAVARALSVRVRGAVEDAALRRLPAEALATAVERWPDQVGPAPKAASESGPGEALLVLASEALANAPALASFLSWKHQRGVAVTLRTLSPQPGVATVRDQVRRFAEAVGRANVLLLGDEVAIPPGQSNAPPSDTVYAMLDGSGDRYHDLAIGRITATSAADMALQLARAEMYERWQWPTASAGAWCPTATCIASNENQGDLGLLDWQAMDAARQTLMLGGYGLCEPLYDTGTRGPTKADLALGWNAGRGLVLYLGHGLQQSWRTTGFAGADVNLLLRYGPSLPFVLSAACHTGNFTLSSDCLCESLLRGGTATAPTGAVAAVGATSAMDWDPPVVMLQSFAAYLAQRSSFAAGNMAFAGGPARTTAGEVIFGAVQRAVDFCLATPVEGDAAARKIAEQTHLFGDPTLGVRTRTPVALDVRHAPTTASGTLYLVQVNAAGSGDGLGNILVCLSGPGTQWLATTDDKGLASVPVPRLDEAVTMTLTAYAATAIPYQAMVTILPAREPLTVLTTDLPTGRRGEPYEAVLAARGGTGQGYRWTTESSLPDGLALLDTGAILGTPSTFGTWPIALWVEDRGDPQATAQAAFELRVESPVYVAMDALPDGLACTPYETAITAAGSWPPFAFSLPGPDPGAEGQAPALPDWLLLSPDGRLTGIAGAGSPAEVTVVVTDAAGNVCTAALPLTVRAPSPDTDGLGGVDTTELLAFRGQVQNGCATADDWLAAVGRWQQDGAESTPGLPGPVLVGVVSARRAMGSSRYLPGGRETLCVELAGAAGLAPGTAAVLTEVLPAGWALADDAARDSTGRALPGGPRRDGRAMSWVLDEQALRGEAVTLEVRPSRPEAEPVVLRGWLTLPEGIVATAGSCLWWARSESEFGLSLRAGWNLVSWPLEFPEGVLPAGLNGLGLRGCAVAAGTQARVTTVAPLVAYWAWAPAARTLVLRGYETDRSVPPTRAGWTACGVPRRTVVGDLPGGTRITVWGWGRDGWEPATDDLVPGRGYLVFRP